MTVTSNMCGSSAVGALASMNAGAPLAPLRVLEPGRGSSVLFNTTRGPLVDEAALIKALEPGTIELAPCT